MENKSRIAWFSIFYIILFLFGIYNLIFLVIIWENHELLRLYSQGFKVIGNNNGDKISSASSFAIYGLITIGTVFAFFGILGAILSQTLVSIADTPRKKLVGLIVGFTLVIVGFYFGFISQLFYYQWNNSAIKIVENSSGITYNANHFYQNWLNIIEIWSVFAIFLILLILSIFLILKLHQKNLDWTRHNNANQKEELNLEITAPFPSNSEFDPNETQTITLNLDTTDKIMARKKKKQRIKKLKKNK